jgi:hypothetical protein
LRTEERGLLPEALPDVKCDCARLDGRKRFAATVGDKDVSCSHGFGGNRLTIDVAPRESMLLGMQMKFDAATLRNLLGRIDLWLQANAGNEPHQFIISGFWNALAASRGVAVLFELASKRFLTRALLHEIIEIIASPPHPTMGEVEP